MKVKIKDLKPNPYRDMDNYPIDENKVKSLMDSIEQTGFWDNILARPKPGFTEWQKRVNDGEELDEMNSPRYLGTKKNGDLTDPIFEIAYGHHRLEALEKLFKATDEVDIPVKELNESTMLKIMANENMDDWKATPQVIDETVRVTKKFLEENPKERKIIETEFQNHGFEKMYSKEIQIVAKFLGWEKYRIKFSLERLGMMDAGKIDKQAIKDLPTERAARNFVAAVKKHDIPISKQKAVIKRYLDEGEGESVMKNAAITEKWKAKPKKLEGIRKEKIIKYESYVAGIRERADELFEELRQLAKTEKEIGDIQSNLYRKLLMMSLDTLSKQIELITNPQENENKQSNRNSRSITE